MKRMVHSKLFTVLLTAMLLVAASVSSVAQDSADSDLNGRITLPGDVPAVGARVILRNVPSGTLYGALTDSTGFYRIPDVETGGPYELEASLKGYRKGVGTDIFLTMGADKTINLKLGIIRTRRQTVREEAGQSAGAISHGSLPSGKSGHAVVVLSMDGFRWDYPEIYPTPNLDRLAREGCKAVSLKPSYPSKTFPNHYAIATGLYPDHNGIIQNSFYDPQLDRLFRMGDRKAVEDSIFWQGEAIWETAEKQGIHTASYFWVGSETNARYRPDMRKIYEDGFPFRQQIDTVFKWLSLPSPERPGLVMFYFAEPDKTSHKFGPVSRPTRKTVRRLDHLVGILVKGLDRIHREENLDIDLVILSDHGMGFIPPGHQIFLEDHVDMQKIKRINGGNPVINIEPQPGERDAVYSQLKAVPHLKVWKKEDLPEKYHYGTNPRVAGLIVEADSAYGLEIRHRKGAGKFLYSRGMHGYDPDNRDMHGIFYAMGPSFKTGYTQPAFPNVDIYDLLAKILGIKPAKNDGNFNDVKGMLLDN
jgi:predicted AlkP superfamily pyrophosphatase or phosphodiesterase